MTRVRPFDRRPPGVEWNDYRWHHGTTLTQVRKILMGQQQKRRSKYRAGWARSLPGLYFSRSLKEASRYAAGRPGTEAVLHVRGIPRERQELDEDEATLLVPPDTSSLTARIAERRYHDLPMTRAIDLGLRRLRASGVVPITSMRVLGRLPLVVEAVRMGPGWVEVWARWEEGAGRGRLARVARPARWSARDARLAAGEFDGHWAWDGSAASGLVRDYVWEYTPELSMHNLAGGDANERWEPSEAVSWLRGESEEVEDTEREGYYDRLEAAWLLDPEADPLVVAVGPDGLGRIWDGHHRYAIAAKHGWRTVPAFVGRVGPGYRFGGRAARERAVVPSFGAEELYVHPYVSPRQQHLTRAQERVREVAIALKKPSSGAQATAAGAMAGLVKHPAPVLVPIPDSRGDLAANLDLARALAARLPAARIRAGLRREAPVESSRSRRLIGRVGLRPEHHGMYWVGPRRFDPAAVYFVDNVIVTGGTIEAARRVLGGGTGLAWARQALPTR